MSSIICKKTILLMILGSLLIWTGHVFGATYTWDYDGTDRLWKTAANWSSDTVPTSADNAQIDSSGANKPIIDLTHTGASQAICAYTYVGYGSGATGELSMTGGLWTAASSYVVPGYSGTGTITMSGGTLDASAASGIIVGWYPGSTGTFTISGGSVNANKAGASGIRCGYNGSGAINMTGGSVLALQMLIPYTAGSTGRLHLDGGRLELTSSTFTINTGGLVDISGGTLIISGDVRTAISDYFDNGKITAFDGEGFLNVTYASSKTTVTARPFVLTFSDDFSGSTLDCNIWQNPHWSPGSNRFSQNIEVSGGKLKLNSVYNAPWYPGAWSFGTISSKFWQHYGRFVTSYKCANDSVLNQAFWLNTPEFGDDPDGAYVSVADQDDRFEIDIQETHVNPDQLRMNLHDWRPTHTSTGATVVGVSGLEDSYHTFGFTWFNDGTDKMKWDYDGVKQRETTWSHGKTSSVMEVLFSTLFGDNAATMEVDWVKVYEWPTYWTDGSYTFPKCTIEAGNRDAFTKTFVIMNDTGNIVNFTGVNAEITGTDANQFSCSLDSSSSIPAGKYRLVSVTFAPTSTGSKSAALKIYTDYPGRATTTVNLTGLAETAKATNPSPSNGATGVSRTADLSWTNGFFSKNQDIYFGTSYDAVSTATTASGEYKGRKTTTTYDLGILDYNTTYYWAIDEVDFYSGHSKTDPNFDVITPGTIWSFTTRTQQVPGKAGNPEPADSAAGVSTEADLNWSAGTDADNYDVYFGTSSPGTFCGNQATTRFWPGTMEPYTTYYWHVDANNSLGKTAGDIWSFTTGQATSLIEPNNLAATAYNNYTGREAIYAVNGAGINGLSHVSDTPTAKMWQGANSTLPKWFKVDLGDIYYLDIMKIYNFNWSGYTSRGSKQIDVYYSSSVNDPGNPVDNPSNWTLFGTAETTELLDASGRSDYGVNNNYNMPDKISFNGVAARWVSLKINSHYGGNYCGLSEVQFYGKPAFGDLNSDGKVDIKDLATFTLYWLEDGHIGQDCPQQPTGDFNSDCIVDFADFAIMASNWL